LVCVSQRRHNGIRFNDEEADYYVVQEKT
jgi:hypothetical protein